MGVRLLFAICLVIIAYSGVSFVRKWNHSSVKTSYGWTVVVWHTQKIYDVISRGLPALFDRGFSLSSPPRLLPIFDRANVELHSFFMLKLVWKNQIDFDRG